jgi:hypothetical protein
MPTPPTATGAERVRREQRTADILAMRLQGFTLRDIGKAQSPPVSPQAIQKLIDKVLDQMVAEPCERLRKLELLRLDELQTAYYEKALAGDIACLDRVMTIMVRRARLAGLDIQPSGLAFNRDGPRYELDETGARVIRVEIVGDPEAAKRRMLIEAKADDGPNQPPPTVN